MYFLRAPASQNGLKETNTRLKHQSEQFWVAEKLPKFFELLLKVSYFFLSIHFGLQGLSKITSWGPWTYSKMTLYSEGFGIHH